MQEEWYGIRKREYRQKEIGLQQTKAQNERN